MDVHVDEAGRDNHASGVEMFGVRGVDSRADTSDHSAVEQQVGDGVVVRSGVHDAAVLDQ